MTYIIKQNDGRYFTGEPGMAISSPKQSKAKRFRSAEEARAFVWQPWLHDHARVVRLKPKPEVKPHYGLGVGDLMELVRDCGAGPKGNRVRIEAIYPEREECATTHGRAKWIDMRRIRCDAPILNGDLVVCVLEGLTCGYEEQDLKGMVAHVVDADVRNDMLLVRHVAGPRHIGDTLYAKKYYFEKVPV